VTNFGVYFEERPMSGPLRQRLSLAALAAAFIALALALPGAASAANFSFTALPTGEGEGEVTCKIKEPGEEEVEEEPCSGSYPESTKITVVALAEEGSKFAGFKNGTGSAAGCTAKTCVFTITANSSVNVQFDLNTFTLAVDVTAGEGEVECTAVFEGVVEVGSCEPEYRENTKITLEPAPEEGSEFGGFGGGTGSAAGCAGTAPCSFTIKANSTVNASFNLIPEYTLTIDASGPGTVTGSPGSIACPPTCSEKLLKGSKVTLTAHPAKGSLFAGWAGGGCKGTAPCAVTFDADKTVAAEFEPIPPPDPEEEELELEAGMAKAAASAKVKSGKAALKLSCAGGPCAGTLQLSAKVKQGHKLKSLVAGTAPFRLAAGETKTIQVKLAGPVKQELAKGKSVKAKLSGVGVASSTVTLEPAKTHKSP
jgi:hypothetical protein